MIKLSNVTKEYSRTIALDDVSLTLADKKIYCLLGRNGAGKTTLLKLIAGHIGATYGTIEVNGEEISPINMPVDVNFMESRASQFNMTVSELIDIAKNLQDEFDYDFAKKMLTQFKLDQKKKYKQLSLGMQTMVTTLLSLASNASIIILDEPVLGFDAIIRERFYDLLQESFERSPKLILVSTHLIDEIARVAKDIIIIDQGHILLNTSVNQIDEMAYSLTGMTKDVLPLKEGLNVIGEKNVGGFTSLFVHDKRIQTSDRVTIQTLGLQDFFVSLVGEDA